jgi:hypothetical protein
LWSAIRPRASITVSTIALVISQLVELHFEIGSVVGKGVRSVHVIRCGEAVNRLGPGLKGGSCRARLGLMGKLASLGMWLDVIRRVLVVALCLVAVSSAMGVRAASAGDSER